VADVRGTVTVLFTDQVSSTEAWQQLGEDAANALRRDHTALLDALISRHHGRTVKNTGDGLMAVFGSAVDALDAAVAMQQAVHRRNNAVAEDERIGLRVGVEIGEPSREGDDYFGTPVVVARRLCDSCEGGQVLVSDLIPRLVGTRGGHEFADAGTLELKGFAEPVRGHLLRWEAAEAASQPEDVEAGDRDPAERVPLPGWLVSQDRTRFVGREREL
jgi:class 3 adenylate cyclase